ncbi:MAG: 2-amino-4-hydroxy-6-hydroxymethyldihydropteridine diphosphokinase [Bacteroidota bacterium]|jgi:2-amino-4-hydroxy-6-hydroxymethyldihydropteridine diphosphokinase
METIGPNRVVIAFGSNLGEREQNIAKAIALLGKNCGAVAQVSSYYENPAVGFESEQLFLNGCLLLLTNLMPKELLFALKAIEQQIGRVKTREGYEDRLIDLDIIFYENQVINDTTLQIPHPKYHERDFVLKPLAELQLGFSL